MTTAKCCKTFMGWRSVVVWFVYVVQNVKKAPIGLSVLLVNCKWNTLQHYSLNEVYLFQIIKTQIIFNQSVQLNQHYYAFVAVTQSPPPMCHHQLSPTACNWLPPLPVTHRKYQRVGGILGKKQNSRSAHVEHRAVFIAPKSFILNVL